MKRKREKIFSLTKKDFRWNYYKGSGKGGQKRNKTENCCRCTHDPSGAVGKAEEGRSKEQNKKRAFKRMAESKVFNSWVRLEAAKRLGILEEINTKIKRELQDNIHVEVRIDGKWVKATDPEALSQAIIGT